MATEESKQRLTDLHKKRGHMKIRISAFEKFIETFDLDNFEGVDEFKLRARLSSLENAFSLFEIVQEEIDIIREGKENEEERRKVEDPYFEIIAIVKHALNKFESRQSEARDILSRDRGGTQDYSSNASIESGLAGQQQQQQSHAMQPHPHIGVKLPTIELPKFSGAYENWLEYRDTYKSLIHTNDAISNVQRFHYLRASLGGDAAQVIKSLEFSDQNYQSAWTLLCSRYDNSSLLIHNHVKSLFEIKPLLRESAGEMRVLIDTILKHLSSLSSLGQPVVSWDTLIIYIGTTKLDIVTARAWETDKPSVNISLNDFIAFLKKRADLLEAIETKLISNSKTEQQAGRFNTHRFGKSTNIRSLKAIVNKCTFCKGEHFVTNCTVLTSIPIKERIPAAFKANLCINCLRPGHHARDCNSRFRCRQCSSRHHSLLHQDRSETVEGSASVAVAPVVSQTCSVPQSCTLLATAMAFIVDEHGRQHPVRVLLDSGSQANFITEPIVERLGLTKRPIHITVSGINQDSANLKAECSIQLKARFNSFRLNTTCLVTRALTGVTPCPELRNLINRIPTFIKLADPEFHTNGHIDVLLGSELFWGLLCVGQQSLGRHLPTLQKTHFGWILAGSIHAPTMRKTKTICNAGVCNEQIQNELQKFWRQEECGAEEEANEAEFCNTHFTSTHKRDSDGRFIVTVPYKDTIGSIGNSYETAKKRFYSLERKLSIYPELKSKYNTFIREFKELGHMSLAAHTTNPQFYLPHHAVTNEQSETTKLRVVFDGSAQASCGRSLNNFQIVGPTIQSDLFSIVLRFRVHPYVVTADIEKMYRQVLVSEAQRDLQRILWRDSPDQPLAAYTLNTVTYGTAAASYLAIRCIHELASELEETNPRLANLIKSGFYVDDLMVGFSTQTDAIQLCGEISKILRAGCFNLRKWVSNDPQILKALNGSESAEEYKFGNNESSKMLGLRWSPTKDTLSYSIKLHRAERITKRNILSAVASIFDPLGLVAPCTIKAKILLQHLWKERVTWDESLSQELATEWLKFKSRLEDLNRLQIPRYTGCSNASKIHLHGFCDASKEAYGACIYLLSESKSGVMCSNLLCSKSRVAPLKQQTIPRLELCGALLLANLYTLVIRSISTHLDTVTFWCDSTIVLSWLRTDFRNMKTFIRNRVEKIQLLTSAATWRHVSTAFNPADIVSRGAHANELKSHKNWWHGPDWLVGPEEQWPVAEGDRAPLPSADAEIFISALTCTSKSVEESILEINNFSTIGRLNHVMAYTFRFIHNMKSTTQERVNGVLTNGEISAALDYLIKCEQSRTFQDDIECMTRCRDLSRASKLIALSPFIDEGGIVRVGGRLNRSSLPYSVKHPILLSGKGHLALLLFREEHRRLFHVGPLSLLHSIRQRFWVLRGRDLARRVVHDCMICRRAKPIRFQPKMGDLPKPRVHQSFPFQNSGVDYAGPFTLKSLKGRGGKLYKTYVALFVCLATRAVHLELVTDLSTEAFVASLRRFVSRRGKPSHIFSDNGTNFVGAERYLKEITDFTRQHTDKLMAAAVAEGITWQFIPAHAPNFGGLWEAGVKSVKFHLKRVIADRVMTYEDFYTVLTQIEAILNSRPISPMSTNPNDDSPLTPAHFLIGRPITAVPDVDVLEIPEARMNSYQRTQAIVQGFWQRWHNDYLNQMQTRAKWRTDPKRKVRVGDLILLHDTCTQPMQWKMGRITELHPGHDSIVRVVSIRTTKGLILKRPLTKISPLPALEDSAQISPTPALED